MALSTYSTVAGHYCVLYHSIAKLSWSSSNKTNHKLILTHLKYCCKINIDFIIRVEMLHLCKLLWSKRNKALLNVLKERKINFEVIFNVL